MINLSDTLKTIFKNDMFPLTPSIADKDLFADFPELNLTVDTSSFAEDKGEFELNESICMDGDLKFGKCNSGSVKCTWANVTDAIKGREFILTETVNNIHAIPFGIYKVDSAVKQDDLIFKDIIAYDRMSKVDTDVSAWYNSLFLLGTETYTLAQFRASFLAYVGLIEDTTKLPLPNDSITVTKTIEPASLPGREVIEAIEEINGVFGHINRSGQFTHIILKPAYGDYPTNDYPINDYPINDYPISETDTSFVTAGYVDETITESMRQGVRFEEYVVKEIDKLIIRTDDEDIGSIVGTGTNAYIIQGNFLVYGKGAVELATIARNTFGYLAKRPYRPYESNNIGLPYLEPGDVIKHDQTEPVTGYIFNRTLKGIQALRDEYSASGSQELPQNATQNTEIKILQGKTTKIKKDVDGVRIEVSDLTAETATLFEQTATAISLKANTSDVNSAFEQTANSIALKVAKAEVIQSINLSTEGAKIDVTKLEINGLVTANNNFKILLDGSMEAVNGKFQGQINGGSININGNFTVNSSGIMNATGANINGTLTNTGESGTTTISNGRVTTPVVRATRVGDVGYEVSQIHVKFLYVDGEQFGPGLITTLYARGGGIDSPRHVYLDSGQNLVPSTTSYSFGLGNSSVPWNSIHVRNIYHILSGTIGFYGATPTVKTSVSTLSGSATLANVIDKVNAMINNSHGLW